MTVLLLFFVGCGHLQDYFAITDEEKLLINEVVTSNQLSLQDDIYGSPDWIELINVSTRNINLKSYYITDNLEAPQKAYKLPDIILEPGEYYLLFATKKNGPKSVGFSLKKSGETISLLDSHMETVSSLVVPALIRDISYARRPDGTYGYCDLPTPGAINDGNIEDTLPISSRLIKEEEKEVDEKASSPTILITEIVSKNKDSLVAAGCDGCTEWIELFNPNKFSVDLTGFTLTDDATETEEHNLQENEIEPEQYRIICCGRDACSTEGHLRIDLGLSSHGENLYLFDDNGNLLDMVSFPSLPEDVSWAKKQDNSWGYCLEPTPGAISVEQEILTDLSPQPVDDPFKTVYLNEVLYRNTRSILDEDGDRSDFAELYNGGDSDIDLGGWFLSDNPDKLTKWAFPPVTLESGSYLLIFLSGKDRRSGELHASFSVRSGETLVLYDSNNRCYDSLLIPETAENVSIGRNALRETVFYSHPTPLEQNGIPLSTGK